MSMGNKNSDQDGDIVAEINMTPLIDIMLVLLIIFMVSSSAAIESGLDVSLPEVSAVSDKSDAAVVVSLTKTGELAVQGENVDRTKLATAIANKLKELKTKSVILEGDGDANLESAMEVMDIARAAGAENFSVAAKLKEK